MFLKFFRNFTSVSYKVFLINYTGCNFNDFDSGFGTEEKMLNRTYVVFVTLSLKAYPRWERCLMHLCGSEKSPGASLQNRPAGAFTEDFHRSKGEEGSKDQMFAVQYRGEGQ